MDPAGWGSSWSRVTSGRAAHHHLPGKFLVLRDSIPLGAALLCQVFTRERMTDAVKQSVSSWWECEGFGSCLVFEPGKAGAVAVLAEPALS